MKNPVRIDLGRSGSKQHVITSINLPIKTNGMYSA